jgi:ABC-2 type transport system permease protein
VFEGLRAVLIDHQIRWDLLLQGFVLDLIIFSLAFLAFNCLLKSARRAGVLLQSGE